MGAGLGLEREEGVEIFRTVDVEAEIAGRQHARRHALRMPGVAVLVETVWAEAQRKRVRRTACEQIGAAVVGCLSDGERTGSADRIDGLRDGIG